jgi:hypothetical protein
MIWVGTPTITVTDPTDGTKMTEVSTDPFTLAM